MVEKPAPEVGASVGLWEHVNLEFGGGGDCNPQAPRLHPTPLVMYGLKLFSGTLTLS